MAIRKDGIESKKRLLEAASEVFALKGYREATVAEICRRAGSNVAAVNYHFGSKDELYIAVWKNAFEQALCVYPPNGGLGPNAKPEERLRALVHSLLHRIMDDGCNPVRHGSCVVESCKTGGISTENIFF